MNLAEIAARVAEILESYPEPWKLKMEGRYGQPTWWVDPLPFNVLNESPELVKLLGFIAELPEIVPALIAEVQRLKKGIFDTQSNYLIPAVDRRDKAEAKLTKIRKAAGPFMAAWKEMHETGKAVHNSMQDYNELRDALENNVEVGGEENEGIQNVEK